MWTWRPSFIEIFKNWTCTEMTKEIQTNNQFQELIEFMVDVVGHQIRKKVRHLFDLKGRLWIAR